MGLAIDDDVESDDQTVESGVFRSYNDLSVVKQVLKYRPEEVQDHLRTSKIWSERFGGTLPYKSQGTFHYSGGLRVVAKSRIDTYSDASN